MNILNTIQNTDWAAEIHHWMFEPLTKNDAKLDSLLVNIQCTNAVNLKV